MTPEKQYQKLKKKHKKLPDLKWLKENFNLRLEEGLPILEQIRVQIVDRIEKTRGLIEPLIGASETYSSWFEKKMLSKREKEDIFKIYKKLQMIYWRANKVGLGSPNRYYVDWLISVKELWSDLKPLLTSVFDKISVSWGKYHKKESDTSYHG